MRVHKRAQDWPHDVPEGEVWWLRCVRRDFLGWLGGGRSWSPAVIAVSADNDCDWSNVRCCWRIELLPRGWTSEPLILECCCVFLGVPAGAYEGCRQKSHASMRRRMPLGGEIPAAIASVGISSGNWKRKSGKNASTVVEFVFLFEKRIRSLTLTEYL